MATTVTDYVDVSEKIAELGCIASDSGVILLPLNFDSAASITELRHAATTSTVKKLLLQSGVPLHDLLERSQRPPYIKNKSADWVFPTIFISTSLMANNPTATSIVLNVVSSYIYEMLRHAPGRDRTAKLSVVVEQQNGKGRTYKSINYEGPATELKTLEDSIREVLK